MKKLFSITIALLLVTSIGYAQNNADVQVKGNDNETTVTQVGSNWAFVYQGAEYPFYGTPQVGTANNNTAIIDQNGNFTAYIVQGANQGIATGSEAIIKQSGINGSADIFQGIGNIFNEDQAAINAEAEITQNGAGNYGSIRQGQVGSVKNVDATLTQTGSGNYGAVLQGFGLGSTSKNNSATIEQNGDNNIYGGILQGVDLGAAGPGSGTAHAKDNSATLIQNGNSGYAFVAQGLNGASAFNNTGSITQNGDFNDAIIYQGVGSGVILKDSDATITQHTDYNVATINQRGVNQSATVTQN